MFKNKILMITGGTGSFGNTVLKRFLATDVKEIRIFSRDEKKQEEMRLLFDNPKLKFYIGDVRNYDSVYQAVKDVDFLFHAAALKQVPSCEFYPFEAVKTNILGSENVMNASIARGVKRIVMLSTDKAVYPINAMGLSKSLMEKVLVSRSREGKDSTIICGTRYGNVMGSRGSVIPLFINQILHKKDLTITNAEMTRFIMSLSEAVELVLFAFKNANPGDIFVQKSPASNIQNLSRVIKQMMSAENHPEKIIGTRHGEKLYETLLTKEEMVRANDLGDYFQIPPDTRDLDYDKFFISGDEVITESTEFHSHNAVQLSMQELGALITKTNFLNHPRYLAQVYL